MTDVLITPAAPSWTVPALAVAVLAVLTAAAVVATHSPTPAPASSQSSAEQSYLRIISPGANAATVLRLGHNACVTMSSGNGTHAEYRRAIGQLMAARETPGMATLIVHTALVSGLCTEAKQ